MFCDKTFLKLAIILFIFQPTYSELKHIWKSPYNESDIYCAENRIKIKFNQYTELPKVGIAFPGSRDFLWSMFMVDYKGVILGYRYYRESMMYYVLSFESLETNLLGKRLGYYAYFNFQCLIY